ncbi:LOW QUALITY PROTEIN: Gag Polyprotein [Phytophthora megakarya]|uniref:Gag Polyprotein n=1 Tax=Phytophthora megakarya TaxID=4795 RepID=A0A225VQ82_9STRA|nr:LOW QUALITY PROTEIN: Gag Polyprotein [Phytophthora megakarya]
MLTDDLVVSVGVKRYAYQVLEYLDQTYEAKTWGNLVAMREKFISLKYKDGQEMTAHLYNRKTLADKLARQGKPVDDQEQVCQPLTSLPESWSHFKSVYFTQDRPLPRATMEGNVMAEFSRRQAQMAPLLKNGRPRCFENEVYMRTEAYLQRARVTSIRDARSPIDRCHTHCSRVMDKHASIVAKEGTRNKFVGSAFATSKNVVFLRNSKSPPGTQQQPWRLSADNAADVTEQLSPALRGEVSGLSAVAGYAAKSSADSDFVPWVIDSRCTQHMTSERSLFEMFEAAPGRKVLVATATMTPVEGVGIVLLAVQMNDSHNERVRLHKVLYVPTLEMNLLSVYEAAQGGAKFDFHTRPGFVIMSLDHRHVTCCVTNKLYVLHSA